MNELSWGWIVFMLLVPMPIGLLAAWPVWRRREMILGNIAGSFVIFGTAFALIFRESSALSALQQECFDAGFVRCSPLPRPFTRYTIYAVIGLVQVVALFMISLSVEKRDREQAYAPEWRR